MILFKKTLILITCTLCLFLSFTTPIKADIGPKPSVTIIFEGIENQEYYATLLSKHSSNGPNSAYDGTNPQYTIEDEEYAIWKAFTTYEDTDGYYFLQYFWNCTDKHQLRWGYYPPQSFKVLVYFPETDTFIVSDIYERYAFDSYFTMNIQNTEVIDSYNFTLETINLIVRILLTILLEIGIALLFKIKQKNQLLYITIINVITQIGLNITLNVINIYKGQWAFVFYYVLLEILIIIIEAIFYRKILKNGKAFLYALIANLFSLGLGLWIAHLIPGIF